MNIDIINMKEETKREGKKQETFGQLLDEFDYERPKRGQVLEGEIMVIEQDGILLDVGLKRDAIVPAKELSQTDDGLLDKLNVGDHVPVYVTRPARGNEELWVSLQRAVEDQNWDDAKEDLENENLLELKVTGQNRGGLLVRYKQIEGFIPNSHIPGLHRDHDHGQIRSFKSDWIGKEMAVKTIEVDRQRRKLVFSATFAQEEKRQKRLLELKLQEGQTITGEVVNVVDFGVFVALDGVDGLVHVSELDWGRVEDPGSLYKPGDEIEVEILEVDIDRERVTLSRKSLLPNPWVDLVDRYEVGDVIECEIVQIMDFGAFVQLPEGVQGLIPKNELGYAHTDIPQEAVKNGDKVIARILSMEAEEGRMALSMRQVPREKQIDWLLSDLTEIPLDVEEESDAAGEEEPEVETTSQEEIGTVTEAEETEEDASVSSVEPETGDQTADEAAQQESDEPEEEEEKQE
jgi:small subunit ribosomal protein S1